MILRHLRYFVSVAEHGSIVGAARALRLAQPALSRQIRSLERTVGVTLLDRTRRGIRITPAGAALLKGAKSIAAHLDEALFRASLADEGRLGTLRLGLGRAAVQSSRVGRAVAALHRHLPDVQLEVIETGSFNPAERLLSGSVDLLIGVQSGKAERGLRHEVLFSEHVDCAMISSTHPLANEPEIRPEQLADERLLMIDPAVSRGFSSLYESLRAFHEGVIEFHQTVDSIYGYVAAGRGWAPALSTLRESSPAGTAVVPLAGFRTSLDMCVSTRAGERSRLVSNAIEVVRRGCVPEREGAPPARANGVTRSSRRPPQFPRNLESRHLRALAVTVAEGSMNKAAVLLGLTQSGLSRRLRALEGVIGLELFRRSASGVVPSEAGQVLRAEAVAILGMLDDAIGQARGAQHGRSRPFRIGAVPNELTGQLLVGVLRNLGHQLPNLPVEVTELLSPQQILALRNNEIDIGVTGAHPGPVDDPSIASVQIGEDAVECALLATSHPLAKRAWLTADDLADIPFLFLPRDVFPRLYDVVMSAFAGIGLTPRIDGSFTGPRSLWRLAADAMGWTIGTRQLRTNPPPGLVAIPIEGLRVPAGIRVLWRREESDPRVKAVLDVVRGCGAVAV